MKPNQQQQPEKELQKCSDGSNETNTTRWLQTNNNNNNRSSSDNESGKTDVWLSTNFTEERQRIREFWMQLSEIDRRSLIKVEKEAVLRKMKEQQRHSCNCSVCGKKRSAIEAELEVLYDAYYDELEQYAHRQQQNNYTTVIQCKKEINRRSITAGDEKMELTDTLTVKGAVITVADDLLKNNGRKLLDMMEKLAERKLFKEREAGNLSDKEDEEEEEKDSAEAKNDDDEEEVYPDPRTEDQRMEEGRKMFQVFAARMFEQRVLAAYREKVAQDRQRRLIEELEEEERQRQERELRKQQEKERKRDKKRQLKLQQEKERLELEKKKKEEEMAAKADRERKAKMERQIREQERQKREEERLQREKDRLRKEQEKKKRRLKEEADKEQKRKEEAERQQKIKEEEERKRQLEAEKEALAKTTARNDPLPQKSTEDQHHHVLTDSTTTMAPIDQRRKSITDPIGSPARSRCAQPPIQCVADSSEAQNSFFSNFLFSHPTPQENPKDNLKKSRRVSSDGAALRWSNGWTPLTALSDNVHGKLFGDVLAGDRNTVILERARFAYVKLDELAQTKFFMRPNFHTLDQLHRMVRDLFHDMPIDPREVYEVINHHPASEFKCYYNQSQQCYIVQHGILPSRSASLSLLPTTMISSPLLQPQLHAFQNSLSNITTFIYKK